MTDLAKQCHDIAVSKGFWQQAPHGLEAFTWRQLTHIIDEFYEYINETDKDKAVEELADVCIVVLDLLGAHNYNVTPSMIIPNGEYLHTTNIIQCVGLTANYFRKNGILLHGYLIDILSYAAFSFGHLYHTFITDAIDAKCEKNKHRIHGYGVFVQPTADQFDGNK